MGLATLLVSCLNVGLFCAKRNTLKDLFEDFLSQELPPTMRDYDLKSTLAG